MNTKIKLLILFSLFTTMSISLLAQTQSRPASTVKDTLRLSYEDEIKTWHERRIAGLKRPQGWLSLVALRWLDEGKNSVESLGTVNLSKGTISARMLPDIQANMRGKIFTSGVLRTDAEKGGPDKVVFGPRAFTIIKRGDRYAVRMWDSTAATLKHFSGIDRFPVSKDWKIEARWEPYATPKRVKVPSVISDYVEESDVPGVAVFSVGGRECRLEPVESGNESLFFVFADKTNGKETYGAGRFLYTDPPKDGKVVLDFNKAYNPPCAFTPYATCPLPPVSNRLAVRIEAGEKKFGDH